MKMITKIVLFTMLIISLLLISVWFSYSFVTSNCDDLGCLVMLVLLPFPIFYSFSFIVVLLKLYDSYMIINKEEMTKQVNATMINTIPIWGSFLLLILLTCVQLNTK